MRIALTHNLRLSDSVDEAEFDSPDTIDALTQSLASTGHDIERKQQQPHRGCARKPTLSRRTAVASRTWP